MINSIGNRDYFEGMTSRLPRYDKENHVQMELLKTSSEEFVILEGIFNRIARNLFLSSAVELIYYFEKELNIIVDFNSSIEKRREIVINTFLSIFEQTTKESLLKVLNLIVGTQDSDIRTTDVPGIYEVILAVYQEIGDYDAVLAFLEKMIPAHLMYRLTIIFKTHVEVRQAVASVIGNIEFTGDEDEDEITNMSFINLRINVFEEARSYIGTENYSGEENMEDEYR